MKASELIEKLQALKEQFGDLPVEIWTLKRFYSPEIGGIKKALFPEELNEVVVTETNNKRSINLK